MPSFKDLNALVISLSHSRVGCKDPSALHVTFLQRAQSELAAHQKKILHVDNHIGISIAGLTADARLLWSVTSPLY